MRSEAGATSEAARVRRDQRRRVRAGEGQAPGRAVTGDEPARGREAAASLTRRWGSSASASRLATILVIAALGGTLGLLLGSRADAADTDAVTVAAPAAAGQFQATIGRDSHGIPTSRPLTSAESGFGYGYAFAEDNICTIAETYVTVRAERSRYTGDGVEGTARTGRELSAAGQRLGEQPQLRLLLPADHRQGDHRGPARRPGRPTGARDPRGRPRLRRRLQQVPRRDRRRQPARPALPRSGLGSRSAR